ncbi:transcription factor, putative [Candida dubliniensis CD36]|uniref:Transcription factor, putative n=1 Tax=Candida dubliniensis (strain CD36 / ATCC MYA-646 / CBS 7987 / NCPF 3949 / NRRL Y-17841) TaxID=573826 RepID=B9WFI8_CANDC|nr:transcription factor, putative [Candida dubliniensis CD36]CAX42007.1 transcription factor, putative [Candida dubliniensis CD36]
MGRRKIEIEPLTDDRNRTVTFVKRKAGLFKKAHELAVLCQVDLTVIIVGSNNKVYEYSTVEANEIFNAYNKTLKVRKQLHESKSPENYSKFRKKRHLHEPLTNKSGSIVGTNTHLNDEDYDHNVHEAGDEDSEYDSDDNSPQPKRHKRSESLKKDQNPKVFNSTQPPPPPPPPHISLNNVPTFTNPKKYKKSIDETNNNLAPPPIGTKDELTVQRPVLRVQIPIDAKSNKNNPHSGVNNSDGKDTARTVTAIENSATNQNTQSSNTTSGTGVADTNSSHVSSNGNSNLVPGNVPNTRFSGYSSFRSPDSRRPTLPLPLQTKSQTSSPASAAAPGLPLTGGSNAYFAGMQQSPSGSSYANYPAQVYQQYQQFQNQLQEQQQQHQHQQQQQQQQQQRQPPQPVGTQNSQLESAVRFRSGLPTGVQFNGEQTPISGLPSRYVNDMFPFPSPSNFLAPQDWPSGITPTTHIPQYFVNMPLSGIGPQQQQPQQAQQQQQVPVVATPTQTQTGQQMASVTNYKSANPPIPGFFQNPTQATTTSNATNVSRLSDVGDGTNPTTAGSGGSTDVNNLNNGPNKNT